MISTSTQKVPNWRYDYQFYLNLYVAFQTREDYINKCPHGNHIFLDFMQSLHKTVQYEEPNGFLLEN